MRGKSARSVRDRGGKWEGEQGGVKVALTFAGGRAHWQVDFLRAVKPGQPASREAGGRGGRPAVVVDAKAGRVSLYLPAYLGDNEAIRRSSHNGLRPVGQVEEGVDGTIRLRILPTGYEDLAAEAYDYPAAEGLVLRRVPGP
jgi:hypothetical protein